jgi:uncharacterized delta-60 repeat protein
VLSDDSIVVTGFFNDTATFGPGEGNETVLSSAEGSVDLFIARYNPNGTLHWARRTGGTSSSYHCAISAISVLSDNSIVVTGYFEDTATFGPGEGNETVFSSADNYDIFIARYNSDGMLNWARRAGGTKYDRGYAISALSDDSLALSGYFVDTATFGKGEGNETVLTSASVYRYEIFIARYNPNGTLNWAKRAGGTRGDLGRAISVLPDDSIIVTGAFKDTATFGPSEGNETVLTSEGDNDIFIARYNPNGALNWARRAGGTNSDGGQAISVLSDDSIVIIGVFWSTATFGSGEGNETVLSFADDFNTFIARYNPDGTLHWARRAGGTEFDCGHAISVLSDDSIAVTGRFLDTATFGPGEGNETELSSAGQVDIFIARYNPDGTLHWARRAGGTNYDRSYAISLLSDDSIVLSGSFEGSTTFDPGEANETMLSSAGDRDIFIARYRK